MADGSPAAKTISSEMSESAPYVVTITLAKEPVNSMSLEFWRELEQEVQAAHENPKVRAILFQSGLKKNVFTAGLDLKELVPGITTRERQRDFWATMTRTLALIYGTSKTTVALVNGACPAGGCGLSLCCDLRFITADGSMGLNEVQIGLPVPEYWIKLMVRVIGERNAEKILVPGIISKVPELVKMNMVDAVVEKKRRPESSSDRQTTERLPQTAAANVQIDEGHFSS
mmetsp:Transcript_28093/g.71206  ORF Transcript_28093/g.71206 Transcript_28093/m.71206 type:complete len:229 (+) Transcript_28093:316-1002(+)